MTYTPVTGGYWFIRHDPTAARSCLIRVLCNGWSSACARCYTRVPPRTKCPQNCRNRSPPATASLGCLQPPIQKIVNIQLTIEYCLQNQANEMAFLKGNKVYYLIRCTIIYPVTRNLVTRMARNILHTCSSNIRDSF